jgi:hypothetical protein
MALMLDIILRIGLLIATSFLFGIVLLSYIRIKNTKLLHISIGFGVFLLHALLYMPQIMIQDFTFEFTDNLHILINLIALTFITMGILREAR